MRKIAAKLARAFHWLIHCMPELLLALFLLAIALLAALVVREAVTQVGAMWADPKKYWAALLGEPWMVGAVAVCLAGTAAVAVLVWRNWTLLWAVARKMIVEALHRKVVLALLAFFVVLTLSLPFLLKTEGTITSQVQIVLLYSLVLAMVLLSLVAIFVSAASICSEIEKKQVQITDTKPLRRWHFVAGKWLGTVVMCSGILAAMSAAAYALVMYLAREPDYSQMSPEEAAKAQYYHGKLWDEILVARDWKDGLLPDGVSAAAIEKLVDEAVAELEKQGEFPSSPSARKRARENIRNKFVGKCLSVRPGGYVAWTFRGLEPRQDGTIYVRFKALGDTPRRRLIGRWVVGRKQKVPVPDKPDQFTEQVVRVGEVPCPPDGWPAARRLEIEIPAHVVGDDGSLHLMYENHDNRGFVQFSNKLPISVLQRRGGFFGNYYRSVAVIMCHVMLLAALGLMAGSLFSFPVASLTVVFFALVGLMGPWLMQFTEGSLWGEYTFWQDMVHTIVQHVWRVFLAVVPHFGAFNPLGNLTDGKMVTWNMVFGAGAVMVFLKGGLALAVGVYFYSRRELARVIV